VNEFTPVTVEEVAAILRKTKLRESKPLPCEPTRIIPPRTPGWTVHQDDHTTVQVSWHGQRERYVHERLDRCIEALEAAGLNVYGMADAPRFWLDVFRRSEVGE
jgi:hypothetical protein